MTDDLPCWMECKKGDKRNRSEVNTRKRKHFAACQKVASKIRGLSWGMKYNHPLDTMIEIRTALVGIKEIAQNFEDLVKIKCKECPSEHKPTA